MDHPMTSGRKLRRQIKSRKMEDSSRHRMSQRERRGISQVSRTNTDVIVYFPENAFQGIVNNFFLDTSQY